MAPEGFFRTNILVDLVSAMSDENSPPRFPKTDMLPTLSIAGPKRFGSATQTGANRLLSRAVRGPVKGRNQARNRRSPAPQSRGLPKSVARSPTDSTARGRCSMVPRRSDPAIHLCQAGPVSPFFAVTAGPVGDVSALRMRFSARLFAKSVEGGWRLY